MLSNDMRAAVIAAASILTCMPAHADAARSVWDGVYSAEQATRGEAAYSKDCGLCHGATLAGTGEAPGLAGTRFLSKWNGLTLGDLFDRIRTTMPMDRPGRLSREAYGEVLAYLLKFNGFPAGTKDLSSRTEMLASIGIALQRPASATGTGPSATSAPAPATSTRTNNAIGPNNYPNPYQANTRHFRLPSGRSMGSSSAVAIDGRGHLWIADRCGMNSCAESKLDPIMEFDADGKFIRAFGGNLFSFPHGLFIDVENNIWLTDALVANGKGATVTKLSPDGKVLMVLGKPGVSAIGTDTFLEPSAVLVAPDGSIFITDGHDPDRVARVMKFDANGNLLKQWGSVGAGRDQLNMPHALAMDSRGRLFVGDRANNRVQIYDQDGNLLDSWTQFGRPSGLFIDRSDVLYATDSESRTGKDYGHNPGWQRGIRIGSVRDGQVIAFIPETGADPETEYTSGSEGVWVDREGVIYGAQVLQKSVVRYTRAK